MARLTFELFDCPDPVEKAANAIHVGVKVHGRGDILSRRVAAIPNACFYGNVEMYNRHRLNYERVLYESPSTVGMLPQYHCIVTQQSGKELSNLDPSLPPPAAMLCSGEDFEWLSPSGWQAYKAVGAKTESWLPPVGFHGMIPKTVPMVVIGDFVDNSQSHRLALEALVRLVDRGFPGLVVGNGWPLNLQGTFSKLTFINTRPLSDYSTWTQSAFAGTSTTPEKLIAKAYSVAICGPTIGPTAFMAARLACCPLVYGKADRSHRWVPKGHWGEWLYPNELVDKAMMIKGAPGKYIMELEWWRPNLERLAALLGRVAHHGKTSYTVFGGCTSLEPI